MELIGPEVFPLKISPERCGVVYPAGSRTFTGNATSASPKLYVVTSIEGIEYVGVTRQSLSQRLRLGWKATGASGYHGSDGGTASRMPYSLYGTGRMRQRAQS
jgi:hypothetical protein